ncbi:HAD family hydrolase [Achromobacter ruhlandii]|uniref:HAD family hydrolase n=2 Tax=Achromobacter ruhlandii TaxID=72557 RepID=A0A848NCC2_9BURK|nr:HAD family hydrolase [Achromobacter ruhlandii]
MASKIPRDDAVRIVAAFDFDGTLTYRDTLIPFLWQVLGGFRLGLAFLASARELAMYALGRISNEEAKQRLIEAALKGKSRTALQRTAKDWIADIPLRQHMLERLKWHQESGHYCVMVSASPDVYLEEMAKRLGFDALICTQLQVEAEGTLSGRFDTPNCWGKEKVRRLEEQLGPLDLIDLYAYGDSSGDFDMLDAARHAWFKGKPRGV